MARDSLTFDKERLKALEPLVEAGRATIPEFIECARLLRRRELLTQGREGGHAEAERVLERALQEFPDSPELTYELASIKKASGNRSGDPTLLRRAMELFAAQGKFPQADQAANDLATDIFEEGCEAREADDLEAAERCFRRALTVYPLHADAHVHLGIVCEERGDWVQAAHYYWRGAQLGRISCHEREMQDRQLGKSTRSAQLAKTHYWGILETRPYLRALHNLARLYYTRKEFELALPYAEESLRANPDDNTGARFIVYSVRRWQGRKDEIRRLARKYGARSLAEVASQLEQTCFGSALAPPGRRNRPN